MKVIFSHWKTGNHDFCNSEMAKLSNDFAKKLGYKTCLYTDQIGYVMLKNVVNYDEIIIFDKNILSKFSPKIWSLGKLLAMSLVNEPFIHIDFDMFLFQKLDENLIKKDFFAIYKEPWLTYIKGNFEKIYNLYPNKNDLDINKLMSSNFAIVGGQNFEKINEVCKKIINFAILFKEDLEKIVVKVHWELPVIFEQILIPNMLSTLFNIETETLFPDLNEEVIFNMNKEEEMSLESKAALKKYIMTNYINYKLIHLHGDKINKLELLKTFI